MDVPLTGDVRCEARSCGLACVRRAVCHRRTEREIEETVNTARVPWVGLRASVGRVRYVENVRTQRN